MCDWKCSEAKYLKTFFMSASACRDWEGKGGKYLEDCQVGEPHDPDAADAQQPLASGYAPHAYDAAKEKRLWDESLQLVGLA